MLNERKWIERGFHLLCDPGQLRGIFPGKSYVLYGQGCDSIASEWRNSVQFLVFRLIFHCSRSCLLTKNKLKKADVNGDSDTPL